MALAQVVLRYRRHYRRLPGKDVEKDRGVVGAEVPEGVDVLPDWTQRRAHAVHVLNAAQLMAAHQLAYSDDRRVVDEGVARHHDAVAAGSSDAVNLLLRRRQRL